MVMAMKPMGWCPREPLAALLELTGVVLPATAYLRKTIMWSVYTKI
jgi:hypothetical protein